MGGEVTAHLPFVYADQETDGKKRGTGGDHHKDKNERTAKILFPRALAQLVMRRHQNGNPVQRQNEKREGVPARNRGGRETNVTAERKKHRRSRGQPDREAMPSVQATGKIDNPHVRCRVTKIRRTWQAAARCQSQLSSSGRVCLISRSS